MYNTPNCDLNVHFLNEAIVFMPQNAYATSFIRLLESGWVNFLQNWAGFGLVAIVTIQCTHMPKGTDTLIPLVMGASLCFCGIWSTESLVFVFLLHLQLWHIIYTSRTNQCLSTVWSTLRGRLFYWTGVWRLRTWFYVLHTSASISAEEPDIKGFRLLCLSTDCQLLSYSHLL